MGGIAALYLLVRSGGMSGGGRTAVSSEALVRQYGNRIRPYVDFIMEASARYDVPASIIASMIRQESNFNEDARGGDGEIGLMQLKPVAMQDLKEIKGEQWNRYDPRQNVLAGTSFLALQKRRWTNQGDGTWFNAIRAYNGGFAGTVRSRGLSTGYADSVLSRTSIPRTAK